MGEICQLHDTVIGCKILETQNQLISEEKIMSQAPMSPDVTSDDKLWAMLAYVFSPLIPIILMLMEDKKNRPYIRANNAQALALGIITVITSTFCVGILVWFYQLYCGYQAYQGIEVKIPVISDFVKNQGWA
jgi:uncharacterized membrane protein